MRNFRRVIGPVLIAAVLVGAVLVGNGSSQAATPKQVGIGPRHSNVIEYTGRINQNGNTLTFFGYLTFVRGLPSSALFSDVNAPSESTAYLTYYGTAQIVRNTNHGHAFNAIGIDQAAVYRDSSHTADFNTPSSFQNGTHVATYKGRWQNVLSTLSEAVVNGQEAVANGVGDLRQRFVRPFGTGGHRYQFGTENLRYRFQFYGWGELDNTVGPVSHIYTAGHATRPE